MYSHSGHRGRRLSGGRSCHRTSARVRGERRGLPIDAGCGPRPGVRGESRPGRAAPRRIGGRPNGARRPELPPSGGVLAQCGRGRAPRLGGSRRLPRPNDLLLRDLRWVGGSGASRKTRGRCVPACAGRLPGSPRPGSRRKRGAPVRCGQGGWRGSRRLPAEPRARAASRLRGLRSGVRRWPGPRGSCARAARWPRRGHRPRGRCGRPRVRWAQLVPGGRQWWRMRHGGRRKGRVFHGSGSSKLFNALKTKPTPANELSISIVRQPGAAMAQSASNQHVRSRPPPVSQPCKKSTMTCNDFLDMCQTNPNTTKRCQAKLSCERFPSHQHLHCWTSTKSQDFDTAQMLARPFNSSYLFFLSEHTPFCQWDVRLTSGKRPIHC